LGFFKKQGAIGGKLSAAARIKKLTPEQRSAIAKKAVAAREAKAEEVIYRAPASDPSVRQSRISSQDLAILGHTKRTGAGRLQIIAMIDWPRIRGCECGVQFITQFPESQVGATS